MVNRKSEALWYPHNHPTMQYCPRNCPGHSTGSLLGDIEEEMEYLRDQVRQAEFVALCSVIIAFIAIGVASLAMVMT
jgi:hypothetical protein